VSTQPVVAERSDAIRSEGLVRTFGRVRALDGLDLAVRTGEILGLVGPNGAGKTTFIRSVAGLLKPTSGTLQVLGERPGRGVAAGIGYMTQSAALYEDLPVRDNLAFFGRLFGLSTDRIRERTAEVLEIVELQGKERALVRHLSGGMRQLTNLACAMIHGPRLLLLDEPTVGIDPMLRLKLWDHFRDLNAVGTTILVTTHVMEEAERCHRVAMIADGKSIAVGSPVELRERAGTRTIEEAWLALRERHRNGSGA
jgi:ABC-2 type transport system ATP-binding protein